LSQEAIVLPPFVSIALRPRPGVWEYFRINAFELSVDSLNVAEYLRFKEELVDREYVLTLLCRILFSAVLLNVIFITHYKEGYLLTIHQSLE